MNLTLLLDLDNTLLINGMDVFLPEYFRGLADHVAPLINPTQFIDCLLAATSRAIENDNPQRTILETFEFYFYGGLDIPRATLQPVFESFYKQKYPGLSRYTDPNPATQALISAVAERGYRVAIATNPLFPRVAIDQRLSWSGLPSPGSRFDLVASMETFHFAKPNPAFFAEVLAQLGWPEGQAIVVGDDVKNDIIPANTLGLPTYQVLPDLSAPSEPSPANGTGVLADFLSWLDQERPKPTSGSGESPAALRAVLSATPAALDTRISREKTARLQWKPEQDEWNMAEVLCHLRDVEAEVQLPRLQTILAQENPFLTAENTDAWAAERGYAGQDGREALADFTVARRATLQLLNSLPDEDWDRRARHAIFGPTSLRELVVFMAEHDRLHIRQIHKLATGSN